MTAHYNTKYTANAFSQATTEEIAINIIMVTISLSDSLNIYE